jgi:hypothetical protein
MSERSPRTGSRLLSRFMVVSLSGKSSYFDWQLVGSDLILRRYTEQQQPDGELRWQVPKLPETDSKDAAFTGNPDPEKLQASVHVSGGRLFLYEDYSNYRWSWGRGSNRITLLQPGPTGAMTIRFQDWGQKQDKDPYWGYMFFPGSVVLHDGTDLRQRHYQSFDVTGYLAAGATGPTAPYRTPLPGLCQELQEVKPELYFCYAYTEKTEQQPKGPTVGRLLTPPAAGPGYAPVPMYPFAPESGTALLGPEAGLWASFTQMDAGPRRLHLFPLSRLAVRLPAQ